MPAWRRAMHKESGRYERCQGDAKPAPRPRKTHTQHLSAAWLAQAERMDARKSSLSGTQGEKNRHSHQLLTSRLADWQNTCPCHIRILCALMRLLLFSHVPRGSCSSPARCTTIGTREWDRNLSHGHCSTLLCERQCTHKRAGGTWPDIRLTGARKRADTPSTAPPIISSTPRC